MGWMHWSQIASRFRRVEPRRRVRAYLQGLLCPVERENGWQLAENAGDCTPDGVQDFLARMRWNRLWWGRGGFDDRYRRRPPDTVRLSDRRNRRTASLFRT